jgi:UPF0755 protein
MFLSYFVAERVTHEKFVEVPGGSLSAIIARFAESGIDVGAADKYLIRFLGEAKRGYIDMGGEDLTRLDFYFALIAGRQAYDEIALIPGETTLVLMDQIAEKLTLDPAKLLKSYRKFAPLEEGVLIPETYRVPKKIDEDALMNLLVQTAMKIHKDRAIKAFGSYDEKQWFRIVTIASIVQKEAASNGEMPLVASVIYNRLAKNMRLEMDGALNYGYYSHTRVTAQRIRADESDFNTYKKRGLPPIPVAIASTDAVNAALKPAETNYFYFVRSANDPTRHDFSTNYNDHLKNIRGEK